MEPGGFPGGCVNEIELRRMASGEPYMKVMQCHCTPDGEQAKVCVGFALRVGDASVGYRLCRIARMLDEVEDDGDLLNSVDDVIERHNTSAGWCANDTYQEHSRGRDLRVLQRGLSTTRDYCSE